jgi:peptidoglycan/LPS O-acetylase OafA/YrhL
VSGFLITRVIAGQKGGLLNVVKREFYARRCGRILPLLLFCLLLGAAARIISGGDADPRWAHSFGSCKDVSDPFFWGSLFFFIFNWYRCFAPVHGLHWEVLWSLSIEEQFYLFYPILIGFLGNRRRLVASLAGIVVFGIIFRCLTGTNLAVYSSFGNFDAIALGALLFILSENYGELLRKNPSLCRTLCIGGSVLLMTAFFFTNPYDDKNFGSTYVAVGLFLFLMGGLRLNLFKGRISAALCLPGRLSYGCYLLHPMVIFLSWPFLAGKTWPLSYGLFVGAVVAVAWISYKGFEVPMNRVFRGAFLDLWPGEKRQGA